MTISVTLVHADHASEVADIPSHPLTAPSYPFSPLIPCDLLL